jgi:hypothetical protein
MATYIYKGENISHSKLLMLLHSAHIFGGNKLSHYEVLIREAEKGNERATSILKDLEVK